MNSSEETQLVKKAKKGDVSAFETLIESHQKKIYNLALNFTKNHHDALDLSQEAFLKAFRNIKNFNEDSLFSTWLYKITTNLCTDHYRKQSNLKVTTIDSEFQNENGEPIQKMVLQSNFKDPESSYLQKELRELIISLLNKIPIESKTIIVLKDIHQFHYQEISKILDIPLGTVKSRLNSARKTLQKILKENHELFSRFNV
jgi:RNA polymerase sigma-70 factor (ECF subfamily)